MPCSSEITSQNCKKIKQIVLIMPNAWGYSSKTIFRYFSVNTKHLYIPFIQRRPNVLDVSPTLYKCYTDVLCLLGCGQFYLIVSVCRLNHVSVRERKGSCFTMFTQLKYTSRKSLGVLLAGGGSILQFSLTLAPIWLPHWPAWRWTISLMLFF